MKIILNILILTFSLISSVAICCEQLPIYGQYKTVTESHCNMYLILDKDGAGYTEGTCSLQEPREEDVNETTDLTWSNKNNQVTVITKYGKALFKIKKCHSHASYGSNRKSDALILVSGEPFEGFHEFWR